MQLNLLEVNCHFVTFYCNVSKVSDSLKAFDNSYVYRNKLIP
jgi:hypothetical protein